jgi:hypothetical protein
MNAVRRASAAILLGAALCAVPIARPAAATVIVAKDFAALCAEAELIFVGTVSATASRWSDPQRRAIETLVTFTDLTWLRGGPRAEIVLRFAGGEIDGLHEEIAGVPRFAVGERRVIFARDGRYVSPLVGFSQGLFRVVDSADGPVVLDGDAVTADGRAALQQQADEDATTLPLDAFLERVRAQMRPGATP